MNINTLNRGESQKAMNKWLEMYPNLPEVDNEYAQMREDIARMNEKVRSDAANTGLVRKDYYIDVHMGLELFDYLNSISGFSMRVAENDDFWRYLSVVVVPHVVETRWNKENSDHYWAKPTRIWLRSIWWYVFLSWQGDIESTRKVLESRHLSTDTILNFVERSGRYGTCVEAYRCIIFLYSSLNEKQLNEYRKQRADGNEDLFRVVMKLNTAKMMVMDPALFKGGEMEYARRLFKDAGVIIDVT